MSKDPAFLFYPNDWLGGTMGMNFELQGAYLTLLILQFNKGEFTEAFALKTVGELWKELKDKFETDGNLYWNNRLKDEHEKRKNYSKSRKTNRLSKVTYVKHMENENINEIEIKDLDIINLYGEKMISDFLRYWNEPNKKGKCRWELQETWSLKGRLITWNLNSKKFDKSENKTSVGKIQTALTNYEIAKNL